MILHFFYFKPHQIANYRYFVSVQTNIILHLKGTPLFPKTSTFFCLSKLPKKSLEPSMLISYANQYKITISPYGFKIRIA